jgi:replicative DNA helicase
MTEQQYDALAEQAVLAALFSTPEMLDNLSEIIQPEDFYEVRNSVVFQSALELRENGKPYDPINLIGHIKVKGELNTVGGVGFFTEILSPNRLTQYSSDPIGYAEIIKDLSTRRKLFELSENIKEAAALGAGMQASEALMIAEESVLQLAQNDTVNKAHSAADLFDDALVRMEELATAPEGSTPGIPTGFSRLDQLTGGWLAGQVIVLAARPSVGKTALAMDFARAAAYRGGKSVLFFSLEMSEPELMLRLLAAEARVSLGSLKTGRLTKEEQMNLLSVEGSIKNSNLFFDSTPNIGISHIRSRATRQKASPAGLDLIIVDYLGLMKVKSGNKQATRENQVSELSRDVKLLAKELQIPIIMLAQLNRQSEARVDKKPALSDLRESGAIEQDADCAMLIHRPDQSDPNIRPGEADLLVVKNRNGPTDKIPLVPMLEFGKYVQGDGIIQRDMSHYDDEQTVATASEEDIIYPAPSEEDEAPW